MNRENLRFYLISTTASETDNKQNLRFYLITTTASEIDDKQRELEILSHQYYS